MDAAKVLLSVEQYMATTFEHDAEYVDGRIVPRALPTPPHSIMQAYLSYLLIMVVRALGFEVLAEQRIRTRANRYRIPDLCLTRGVPREDALTEPPFLCIEILSPDDTVIELMTRVAEYLAFGVEYVWVIDPVARTGEIRTRHGVERVEDGVFRAGERIAIDVRTVPQ